MNPDFFVVEATESDIIYIDSLQRKNAEALSFYPKIVFEREVENGRILISYLNNQPCGYIYYGAMGGDVKCHQVCIQYDVRRKLYGAMLVAELEERAENSHSITLRCGFDLDANKFWKELGYSCVGVVDGGVRRNRRINIWRKYFQPDFFSGVSVQPEKGKASNKVWAKNKKTGLVSQFARGKQMENYRKLVKGNE